MKNTLKILLTSKTIWSAVGLFLISVLPEVSQYVSPLGKEVISTVLTIIIAIRHTQTRVALDDATK